MDLIAALLGLLYVDVPQGKKSLIRCAAVHNITQSLAMVLLDEDAI